MVVYPDRQMMNLARDMSAIFSSFDTYEYTVVSSVSRASRLEPGFPRRITFFPGREGTCSRRIFSSAVR